MHVINTRWLTQYTGTAVNAYQESYYTVLCVGSTLANGVSFKSAAA